MDLTSGNTQHAQEPTIKNIIASVRASLEAEQHQITARSRPSVGKVASSRLLDGMSRIANRVLGSHSTEASNPLDQEAQRLEEALWSKYGLIGRIVPDELFKECQRRLRSMTGGSVEEEETQEEFTILGDLHRYRKNKEIDGFTARYPSEMWQKVTAVPPSKSLMAVGANMWALLIGNDDYPLYPLGGCINDVVLVKGYLNTYLNVAQDHIRLFANATRDIMINALYDLRDDPRIAFGDNIVIHYSGHGSSFDCDTYFTTPAAKGGSMEAICPIDRGVEVPDICERELNSILSQLRDKKGPNITVILDCCHSGGSLRAVDATATITATVRYVPPPMPPHLALPLMLAAADHHPRRYRDTPAVSGEAWEADLSSFVALAACQDFQLAEEDNFGVSRIADSVMDVAVRATAPRKGLRGPSPRYGRFTWALIKILESEEGNRATYDKVIDYIGRLGRLQVPVVVGSRKDSRLWFQ